MNPRAVIAVIQFEFQRSLTKGRLLGFAVVAFFAPLLFALLADRGVIENDSETWWLLLFYMIPQLTCLLGMLLWATPMLHTELEGKTWLYLAMRPRGKLTLMLGKYLGAILWTGTAGLISLTLSVLVVEPAEPIRVMAVLSGLLLVSCVSYGASYTLIATLFYRRAMMMAVFYTLLFEFALSLVPATVNQFTVHYRVRTLFSIWMDWWPEQLDDLDLLGIEWQWLHLSLLAVYTGICLLATYLLLVLREYVTAED